MKLRRYAQVLCGSLFVCAALAAAPALAAAAEANPFGH
jgi:hypothetical protein